MSLRRPSLGFTSTRIWIVPGIVATLLLGVTVTRVDAGVGGQSTVVVPATAAVGTTFPATITIRNQSTTPNDTENITVTALFLTPACASGSSSGLCLPGNRDPGVMDVLTAVGDASSAPCPGIAFTIGLPDPLTGEVQLTPNQPITLGPSNGPLAARTCQVDLSLHVEKLPANPVPPSIGETNVLGHVSLHGVTSGVNGAASSDALITILPEPSPPPPPPPPQNVPTLSGLASGILAGVLILGGAAVLLRRTA